MTKVISVFLIIVSVLFINSHIFATSANNVNTNTANMVLNDVDGNTVSNSVTRTNSTIIQSVNSIDDTGSKTNVNIILNVMLIAVGFVLILLAVAILIRLRG